MKTFTANRVYLSQWDILREIPALNAVFSEAFTERYRKDGMVGVRVPHLNPAVWKFAITDAEDGAMVWRNAREGWRRAPDVTEQIHAD